MRRENRFERPPFYYDCRSCLTLYHARRAEPALIQRLDVFPAQKSHVDVATWFQPT
jgi:hypothetical protein